MERAALARAIYDSAHLTGEFTLRSGATSTEYFDKYRFESDPAAAASGGRAPRTGHERGHHQPSHPVRRLVRAARVGRPAGALRDRDPVHRSGNDRTHRLRRLPGPHRRHRPRRRSRGVATSPRTGRGADPGRPRTHRPRRRGCRERLRGRPSAARASLGPRTRPGLGPGADGAAIRFDDGHGVAARLGGAAVPADRQPGGHLRRDRVRTSRRTRRRRVDGRPVHQHAARRRRRRPGGDDRRGPRPVAVGQDRRARSPAHRLARDPHRRRTAAVVRHPDRARVLSRRQRLTGRRCRQCGSGTGDPGRRGLRRHALPAQPRDLADRVGHRGPLDLPSRRLRHRRDRRLRAVPRAHPAGHRGRRTDPDRRHPTDVEGRRGPARHMVDRPGADPVRHPCRRSPARARRRVARRDRGGESGRGLDPRAIDLCRIGKQGERSRPTARGSGGRTGGRGRRVHPAVDGDDRRRPRDSRRRWAIRADGPGRAGRSHRLSGAHRRCCGGADRPGTGPGGHRGPRPRCDRRGRRRRLGRR